MFYSPMAWLVLIVFSVISAFMYFDAAFSLAETATMMGGSWLSNTTNMLFSNQLFGGMFFKIQGYIYMFVPLLTMGLISQELSSGTIKLLDSSPVTTTRIVLGKFLSMAVYGLSLIFVIFIFAVFSAANIQNFDWPAIMAGLLGLYLLLLTYSAIGIFMSSLTSYQVVAAICTFALFVLLDFVGGLGQSTAWLKDITFWLGLSGRVEEFLVGMVSSQDIFYFLIITAAFLTLTVQRMGDKKKMRSFTTKWASYLSVVVIAIALGLVSSSPRFMLFKDTTSNERLTITPNSRQVLENIEGLVEVTNYVNLLGANYWGPRNENYLDRQLWLPYQRYKPDIKVKYVYYWHPVDDPVLEARFPGLTWEQRAARIAEIDEIRIDRVKDPEQIALMADLSQEAYRNVVEIKLKDGRTEFLRFYDENPPYPTEAELTSAFKRLADGPVNVGFLVGHGERSVTGDRERDYRIFAYEKTFRNSLINQGFDAFPINLREGGTIAAHIDILVISDVAEELDPHERAEIQKYIDNGGDLIIACEPGRGQYIAPLVEPLGVSFPEGIVVNPESEELSQDVIMANCTPALQQLVPTIAEILVRHRNARISMPGAVGLEFRQANGFEAEVFLMSDSLCWRELTTRNFADETAVADRNEAVGPVPLAMGLSRVMAESGKTQKILVMGDADYISNGELQRGRMNYTSINFNLITEMFAWLSDYRYPIDVRRPDTTDRGFDVDLEKAKVWRMVFVIGLPLLLLLSAVLIIVRRKSK